MDLFCEISLGNIADSGYLPSYWFNEASTNWLSYVEFPENIQHDGDDYLWDLELTFNDNSGDPLMMSIVDNRYNRAVRWINPDYRESYCKAVKNHGYDISFIPESSNIVEVSSVDDLVKEILSIITMINGTQNLCVLRLKKFLETKTSILGDKIRESASQSNLGFRIALECYANSY